jgi:exodeoxyribonuclease V alpha subunit
MESMKANSASTCSSSQGSRFALSCNSASSAASRSICSGVADGRAVTFGFGELDTLVPAYAVTIHKSQGSEYPAVVIPILTQHYAMLQRNLLYTAVTRGKRLVVVVGQKKAVAIAVKNISGRRRWSKLNQWLGATPTQGSSS